MQIEKLIVYTDSDVLRDIPFHSGTNIITNSGARGNQVGKSTALRAISFCLGSGGKSLWKDPETGEENLEVKNFLLNGNVYFELHLKGVIRHELKRRMYCKFNKNGKMIVKSNNWINGKAISSQEKYKLEVARIVFGYEQEKPSFGSLKNKFMRIDRSTSNNSYKFLNRYTSDDEYALIYSTLFGFEGLDYLKKDAIIKSDIKSKEAKRAVLLDGSDIISLSDEIKEIDIEIEHYRGKENAFDVSNIQSKVISNLKSSRKKISNLSAQIANLEIRTIYNNKTIDKYKKNIVSIDIDKVNSIYSEAIGFVPNVTKTLEETINFHNSIFIEKARQSESRNKVIMQEISLYKEQLKDEAKKEQSFIKDLAAEGQLDGFILIEKEIQSLSEQKGRLSYIIDEVYSLSRKLRFLELELQTLKDKIEGLTNGLNTNVIQFNKYFSSLTRLIFKTHANSINVVIDESGNLRFSVINSDKNTGDGSPRAEAMAADIAMVEFLKNSNSKLPYFTLQDYVESVDDDKLDALISYADKHGIQVIISILNDKLQLLPKGALIKDCVLELSQSDKFFKL